VLGTTVNAMALRGGNSYFSEEKKDWRTDNEEPRRRGEVGEPTSMGC